MGSRPAARLLAAGVRLIRAAASREEQAAELGFALQLAPASGAVVSDDLLEHRSQGGRVDGLPLADGDRAGGFVLVAARDDSLWIGDDGAVVEKHVDVILRRQQRADVALEDEVWAVGALDGLAYLRVGGVDQIADLAADGLLPIG